MAGLSVIQELYKLDVLWTSLLSPKSCVKLLVEMVYYVVKRDSCSNPEVY